MSRLFRLSNPVRRDPSVDRWLQQHTGELGEIAKYWFETMRSCGDDVRECLHDGHPTACIADAAFGYVNVFKAHVNVGFFAGPELADPKGILVGNGKFMRHVKFVSGRDCDTAAVSRLVIAAYFDMKARVQRSREEQNSANKNGRQA